MSGDAQAVFVKCKRIDVVRDAIATVLAQERARPQRLGDTAATRLARFARALRAAVYEVDVRDGVATTLFQADSLGRLRISGAPCYFVQGNEHDEEPTGQEPASEHIGFGLLPVTEPIRRRLAALADDDDARVADYLGELAGFREWRSPSGRRDSELLTV